MTLCQCCGSGSGIRDPVPFWPLDPGSGMGRKSASGSGIRDEQPGSYFLELRNPFFLVFLGLKYLNYLMRIGIRDPGWRQFGSGIRNGKKSDPGSGINVPDPQHCTLTLHCKPFSCSPRRSAPSRLTSCACWWTRPASPYLRTRVATSPQQSSPFSSGGITIYAPMIYLAPCVMFLMRADMVHYVGKWE